MSSSTQRLLVAWEDVRRLSPAQRAIHLTALSSKTGQPPRAEMTVGQRDDALIRLRSAAFGNQVASVTRCPDCGENVEVSFDINNLRNRTETDQPDDPSASSPILVEVDGWNVVVRLPTSHDLVQLEQCNNTADALSLLLDLCTETVTEQGRPAAVEDLPESVIAAINTTLADADAQADIQLAVMCPECRNEWPQQFDINSFLWIELDAWARRLLSEVHVLARAYGWSEDQILGLTPLRRRAYLEMVAA